MKKNHIIQVVEREVRDTVTLYFAPVRAVIKEFKRAINKPTKPMPRNFRKSRPRFKGKPMNVG